MTLPFTIAQFLEVFERYNEAIWPGQLLAYAAGVAAVALIIARSRFAGRAAALVLAAMWLVNGGGYHLSFFREVNPAAAVFGALFLLEAVLLAWHGVIRNSLRFSVNADVRTVVGMLAITYAVLFYPLLGMAFGHVYPASPVFGVAPCPTTIFTLGVLLLARPTAGWWLFVIPVAWSAVGGSAAVLLDVREDFALIAAGAAAVLLLAFTNPGRIHEAHA